MEGPGWKACEVTHLESGLNRKGGHKGERKGGAKWGQMIGSFRAWRGCGQDEGEVECKS